MTGPGKPLSDIIAASKTVETGMRQRRTSLGIPRKANPLPSEGRGQGFECLQARQF
jgi:hypothetical protein